MNSWKRLGPHFLFWFLAALFLAFFTGERGADILSNSIIVALLLPIAIATSRQFKYKLIPQYLWPGRHKLFLLYGLFTVILSLWTTMMVVLGVFIFLAEYQLERLTPVTSNVAVLGVGLYFIVLLNVLLFLMRRWSQPQEKVETINIRSDRQSIPIRLDQIYFIESLSNYVKIHTDSKQHVTKETISKFQESLEPHNFIRIHRSYLINKAKVTSFNREFVLIKEQKLTFGRAFKKNALSLLAS